MVSPERRESSAMLIFCAVRRARTLSPMVASGERFTAISLMVLIIILHSVLVNRCSASEKNFFLFPLDREHTFKHNVNTGSRTYVRMIPRAGTVVNRENELLFTVLRIDKNVR